jgi:hypothetical protein
MVQKVPNSVEQLHQPTLQGGPTNQLSIDQCPKADRLTNSPPTNSPEANLGGGGRCSHDLLETNLRMEI